MSDPLADLKQKLARRHHMIGWCGLFVFVCLGFALETLLGLKMGMYLDSSNKYRRELWRLAHAHGTLVALVNIAFAAGLAQLGAWKEGRLKLASFLLIDTLLVLPLGFFLGGIGHTEVDPSPGIWLVPVGALFLVVAVGLIAQAATTSASSANPRNDKQDEIIPPA
jgi:hypothetical protein